MALSLDIMTPEKIILQSQVDAVIIPAWDGELGILTGHAPLLAQLQPGQIRVRRGDAMELFAVSGGFAEVKDNRVAVFAETAEMAQEIDVERARQAAERARAALQSSHNDVELHQAEAALRRAMVRLRVHDVIRRPPGSISS